MSLGEFTHPGPARAGLVDPLFCKQKRGSRKNEAHPLSAAGEERVVEQSDDRVSKPSKRQSF
jgi:hypothetical protein